MHNWGFIFFCLVTYAHLAMSAVEEKIPPKKPNIILFMSDDVGWGDLGCYLGGDNRGAATPNLDRMAQEGLKFLTFYGQPSCTPSRAATMTGRWPIRSGMTAVALPGDGGGLAKEEVTVAEVLSNAGYATFMAGKWHLGEADYSLPTSHGFDEMRNVTLYHLNAYVYDDPQFNPDFPFKNKQFMKLWGNIPGTLRGKKGEKPVQVEKLNSKNIPFLDEKTIADSIDWLKNHANKSKPFFMYINTAKMHQPNLPHPDFVGKSAVKSKYGDSLVELDYRVGQIMKAVVDLGIEEDTLVIWTSDNGAWQDVYPDCGYTPFKGTKGTDYEAGSRVPAIAWWKGHIKPGTTSCDICGQIDFLATFAKLAGTILPDKDNGGKPIIFDSMDLSGHFLGKEPSPRRFWLYLTEVEQTPGAVRYGKWKAVWNTRKGWQGNNESAFLPEIYDLWQDPAERYDIFMNSWAEKTWILPAMTKFRDTLQESYKKYPNRPTQSPSLKETEAST